MKHRADVFEEAVPAVPRLGKHLSAEDHDEADDGAAPSIPGTAIWKSRRTGRTLLSLLTCVAALAVVPAAAYYWQMRTDERLELLVASALFAGGLWACLASRRPQRVTLKGSLLTVKGRRATDTFDLADGMQPIELSGTPQKGRWSVSLYRGDGTAVVLGRHDVDAAALDLVVRHYRDLAERRRARRWALLGL